MSGKQQSSLQSKESASQILVTMRADSTEDTSSQTNQDNIPVSIPEASDPNMSPSSTNENFVSNQLPSSSQDNDYSITSSSPTHNSTNQNILSNKEPSSTQDDDDTNKLPASTQGVDDINKSSASTVSNIQEEPESILSLINNNISTVLSDSSDDELGNKKGPEPIIYDDDLIFDDDEDAKSEAEEPNEQYLPSTDHYRRIFLNASTKIPTNNLFDGLINNQFIPEKFQIPKQWQKTFKSSDNLSGIISCIMLIRKRVVDRKKKSSSKVDIGYRFPLKQVLGPDDRFEMNELASKFYMSEEKSRIPYLWLHYYPPNQNAGNRPVQDFSRTSFLLLVIMNGLKQFINTIELNASPLGFMTGNLKTYNMDFQIVVIFLQQSVSAFLKTLTRVI